MNRSKRLVKSGIYLLSCKTSTKIILVPYSLEYAILQREAFMIFIYVLYSDSTVILVLGLLFAFEYFKRILTGRGKNYGKRKKILTGSNFNMNEND